MSGKRKRNAFRGRRGRDFANAAGMMRADAIVDVSMRELETASLATAAVAAVTGRKLGSWAHGGSVSDEAAS